MKIASEPFAPKRIIINRSLSIASYLVNFFGWASVMGVIYYIPMYIQAVQGKGASETGLWLIAGVAASVTGSLIGGIAIQMTGKFYLMTVGAYAALYVGAGVVLATVGVLVQSFIGLTIGECLVPLANGWN